MADDAAIEDMETADLLCVIYVTGIKNDELREKLLEITDPTIAKFDRVVDSFDQAKKQLGEMKTQPPWPQPNQTEGGNSRETSGQITPAAKRAARKTKTKGDQVNSSVSDAAKRAT